LPAAHPSAVGDTVAARPLRRCGAAALRAALVPRSPRKYNRLPMPPTRRQFLSSTGTASLAAVLTGAAGRAVAQAATGSSPRMVQTEVLDIAYEEHGSANGTPIILLHGFPYDVRSFDGVVAPLVSAGHRVLVPWLRGYGPTRFRAASAPRMAEQAALAQDVIDFANALDIPRFALAGFDWGNRAACIVSILEPERVIGQVSIGGYSVQNTVTRGGSMPARQAAQFWYMWYFNTEQGAAALEANRHDIIRYLWDTWSPEWRYTDEAYARSAPSFDNPDFVAIVVHSYRHRLMNAPGEDRFIEMERRLAAQPPIGVPAIVLAPGATGLGGRPSASAAGDQRRFVNLVARRIVEGAGHDLPAHRPDAVAEALLELVG
jgi:pimeloyl-ACP methyl ester carboxylesterase